MKIIAPIINRPTAVSLPTRLGWQVVAVLIWTLWLSCLTPLLTLVVWEYGLYRLHLSLIPANTFARLQQMMAPYISILGLECAVMLLWACREYVSHGRRQRRQPTPAVDISELAGFGQLPEQGLAAWQAARSITAEHDDHGRLRSAHPRRVRLRSKRELSSPIVSSAPSAPSQPAPLSLVVSPAKSALQPVCENSRTNLAATVAVSI